MGQTLENITLDRYERNLSVSDLNNLYSETVEELHRLSLIVPSGSIDDGDIDKAEAALLDLEAYLLNQASRVPLRDEKDISILMDLWAKFSASMDQSDNVSERIVKNIFRHLN